MLSRRILIGSAAALFLIVCVLPGAYMFSASLLTADGEFTLSNYSKLLSEPRQRELLLTTVTLGAAASAIATILGVPLGFVLARMELPRTAFFRVGLLIPLVIPPYVLALVWIFVTGYSSISYSLAGAALVLGIGFYPLLMLAAEAGFRRVNASLEEAAILTTSPAKVFIRITLPLVAPLVAAAALLVFALAVAEFGVPGLLRVRVFTTEVFTAFAALYDFGRATALAVPLLVVTLFAAVLAKLSAGNLVLVPSTTWRPAVLSMSAQGKALVVLFTAAVVVVAAAVPIVVLAAHAQRLMTNLISSWAAVRISVVLSLITATSIVMLGVLLGYARGRMQPRAGLLTDLILITAFAVPSTVVGIGIIGLWNRPSIPINLYASPITIMLGYMARFLPVAVLIIGASVRQLPVSSEEAAEISGVRWLRGFRGIVIPQIRGGVIAAWIAVFVFSFGELGTTVLVTPPGESTLPVRVYTLIANAHEGEIATLALVQLLTTVVPMCVFGLTVGRAESRPWNPNAFVRMLNVQQSRGERVILDHFSLDLAEGEFVALLGRSGSGKTTILRAIAGLDTPDKGEIWIAQQLVSKNGHNVVPPRLRNIGFVFQDLALWPHMTIAQSLAFVLASSSVAKPERQKRISDALSAARIPDLGDRYPHQLSGGEQQRAALARALAPRPRLLLLDEPLSSVDADLKAELAAELASIHRTFGLTTLYVTHDVAEISRFAMRTISL